VDLPKAHEYISQTTRMTISYYPTYVHVRIPNMVDFNVTIMKPTFGFHGSGANYVSIIAIYILSILLICVYNSLKISM